MLPGECQHDGFRALSLGAEALLMFRGELVLYLLWEDGSSGSQKRGDKGHIWVHCLEHGYLMHEVAVIDDMRSRQQCSRAQV